MAIPEWEGLRCAEPENREAAMANIHDTTNFRALPPELLSEILEELSSGDEDTSGKGWSSLSYTSFRALLLAAVFSNVGNGMQNAAQAWVVYERTRSTFFLGLDTLLMLAPLFLLAFPSGVIVDRYKRKRVFFIASSLQIVCAAVLTTLFVLHIERIWHLLLLSLISGIGQAFANVAYVSLIPRLVPTKELPNATALNSVQLSLARAIGPALAGLALHWFGPIPCFAINGISFLVLILVTLRIRERRMDSPTMSPFAKLALPTRPVEHDSLVHTLQVQFKQLRHYLERRPGLREACLLCFAATFLGGCVQTLLPSFTREIFGGKSTLYTIFLTAYGFGTLAGSLYIAQRPKPIGAGKRVMRLMALAGVSVASLALVRNPYVGVAIALVIGGLLIALLSQLTSLVQFGLADEVRGRVMSLFLVAMHGGYAVGGFTVGAVAATLTAPPVILTCGAILALIALGVYVLPSRIRTA
jgi:predicted MFS family arabinose efflux permease